MNLFLLIFFIKKKQTILKNNKNKLITQLKVVQRAFLCNCNILLIQWVQEKTTNNNLVVFVFVRSFFLGILLSSIILILTSVFIIIIISLILENPYFILV